MKKKQPNIPCRCGHIKKDHKSSIDNFELCWNGWPDGSDESFNLERCFCWQYKPDNLKYLEQIYEKRANKK